VYGPAAAAPAVQQDDKWDGLRRIGDVGGMEEIATREGVDLNAFITDDRRGRRGKGEPEGGQ